MRFISPSFLAFTLLMALLPWVEVRCEQNIPAPFRPTYPVVQQNAFQIALGDKSVNLNPGGVNPRQPAVGNQVSKDKIVYAPAPLLWAFLALILVGGIIGFTVPARKPRLILMPVATLGAGGALLGQVLMGFPLIKESTPVSIKQFLDVFNEPQLRNPEFVFSTGYTIWFYLALVGTAGGIIGVLADALNPTKLRPWADEDDDRPRRRRPRSRDDDYDDDDDRPRRRDDRPRRRDDDDDDDRDSRYRRRNDR